MKSQKISILAILLFFTTNVMSQNIKPAQENYIPITVFIEEQEALQGSSVTVLTNKLSQIASLNGLSAEEYYGRFCITARIAQNTRDILPGPPQQIAQNLDITLYVVDNFDHTIFATTTIQSKGVGITDEKAVINALKSINQKNQKLTDFVNKGRNAIISYYREKCAQIILYANTLATTQQYENALYELASIPIECTECYTSAMNAASQIFQQYTDHLCNVNLAKARSLWMAEQNSQGAYNAGQYLSQIYPEASCYSEAMTLYNEIKSKVLDDWKFEMRMYDAQIDLESQKIEAWRAVGVAYGEHQPAKDYNVNWIVR